MLRRRRLIYSRLRSGYSAAVRVADLQPLVHRLRQLGFTSQNVCRRLSISYPDDIGVVNHAVAAERLRGSRAPLDVLLRLFWLELDEPQSGLDRCLGDSLVEASIAQRLLGRSPQRLVRSRLRIDAAGELLLFADRRFRGLDRGALRLGSNNPVYPPSADSLMLREIVDTAPGVEVLDLCTGSGVLGLSAAARGAQVTAVDVSPRAVKLSQINAAANQLQLEVLSGDLYAPVSGRQFDVIVANPPFVASPYAAGPSYHAGGASGDRVLRRIVRGWSRFLKPGGRAFAISHVALRRQQQLETVAQRWLAQFKGRAELIVLERGGALDLAAAQALFALQRGSAAYARELRHWVAYLARQRIATVVAFILIAENGARANLQIADATPRILPLPFHKTAQQHTQEWFGSPLAEG